MSFADNDACADRAWSNEDWHGDRPGDILRLTPKHLDRSRAAEDELQADDEKDDATEDLERGKISLNNIGEDGVAKDCEEPENGCGNQSGANQHAGELPTLEILNGIDQVNDQEKWVQKYEQQRRRSDQICHLISNRTIHIRNFYFLASWEKYITKEKVIKEKK